MKAENKKSVILITGASSGIGAEAALLFAREGFTVYGASRRNFIPGAEAAENTAALFSLAMDVTSEDSVKQGVEKVLAKEGRLDMLIYAAGDGLYGPVEACSAEDAIRQMDVNYLGALRLLQEVLPVMRRQGGGRVILVGSVAGEFAVPFQALYSGSKAALALLACGLRLELKPFNIHCSLVSPGDTKTGFTAARRPVKAACPEVYSAAMRRAVSRMEHDEQTGMAPEKIARIILKTAQSRRPPAQRVAGGLYRLFVFLKRLLPYALVERLLGAMYLCE